MNGKARRTTECLDHMVEAIRRINAYAAGLDRRGFDLDTRTQDAIIRNPGSYRRGRAKCAAA